MDPRWPLFVAAWTGAAAALAHHGAHDPAAATPPSGVAVTTTPFGGVSVAGPKEAAARLFFGDRRLVTQRGERVAFYSDVLKDRVALISFVFTRCTDACPTQSSKLAAVQALLGRDADPRIALVSISVDPEHDTPENLARYASAFDAGSRWLFLTGERADVHDVLRRLGQLTATPAAHTSVFLAGNARTGRWMKLHPDLDPAAIADRLRALAAENPA